jgi:uncharacterized protein (TIGR00369 family)
MADPSETAAPSANTMSGKPSGFRSLVGYRCIVWARDYAEIELHLAPQHGNSLGITHGGICMTMLDAAMGHAATWCAVPGNVRICVTVSMTTHFVAASKGGTLRAIARLAGVHDRMATITGEVIDDTGALIAAGQGCFRYMLGSERHEGVTK